jgi:peptide/nickel transport system permease protein
MRSRSNTDATEAMLAPAGRWVSLWKSVQRILRVRLALPSAIWLALMLSFSVAPGVFATHSPTQQNLRASLRPPTAEHWLGTDHLGRDIWSRIVHGTRISLLVGVVAVGIAAAIGLVLGLHAGYYGGWIDSAVTRVTDAIWCIPYLVLAIALVAVRGADLLNVMLAIGIVYTPGFARLVRGQAISVRQREFVQAALASGARTPRILGRHLAPNVFTPIVVQSSLMVGHAIIAESSLSFLGLGVPPPQPTWGGLVRDAYVYLDHAPHFVMSAGLFIFVTVLAFNFLGDALRDALDPRLRGVL